MNGKRWAIVIVSAALGVGAAPAVGTCGEDRGSVEIEGASTGSQTTRTSTTEQPADTSTTESTTP